MTTGIKAEREREVFAWAYSECLMSWCKSVYWKLDSWCVKHWLMLNASWKLFSQCYISRILMTTTTTTLDGDYFFKTNTSHVSMFYYVSSSLQKFLISKTWSWLLCDRVTRLVVLITTLRRPQPHKPLQNVILAVLLIPADTYDLHDIH